MSEKLVRTIEATDADGNRYTIHEYQEIMVADSMQGKARINGHKRLVTSDGKHVNYVDEDTFKVLGPTDLIAVKRVV